MTSNCGTPLAPFTVLLHCPQTTENTRVRYRFPCTKHCAPTKRLSTACVKLDLSPYCFPARLLHAPQRSHNRIEEEQKQEHAILVVVQITVPGAISLATVIVQSL